MSEQKHEFLTVSDIKKEYPNMFSRTTLWRLEKRGEMMPCGRKGNRDKIWRRTTIERYLTRYEDDLA